MRAVTIPALRRAGRAHLMAHAVDAAGVILTFFFVTAGAIRRRHIFVVHQFLDAVVTINAIQFAVNGFLETIRGKNGERNFLAVHDVRVLRVAVAIKAVRAGKFFNCICCRQRGRDGEAKDCQ